MFKKKKDAKERERGRERENNIKKIRSHTKTAWSL